MTRRYLRLSRTKPFLAVLLGLLMSFAGRAQDRYRISLLTCSPGSEMYAAFGHTALRVTDTSDSTDTVYNFGLFDFSTPRFYLKFAQGNLLYRLGKQSVRRFMDSYLSENRSVTEQFLDLSAPQAEALVGRLEFLYRPENREYLYRFINRNCTTEPRDILFDVTGIPKPSAPDRHTDRYYLNRCLACKPMTKLGINIILGANIDRPLTDYRAMFLPELLCAGLESIDNHGSPLVGSTAVYGAAEGSARNGWLEYVIDAVLLAILILVLFDRSGITARTVFAAAGVIGIVLTLLTAFSSHPEVQRNFNLLWANPVYLLFPFLGKRRLRKTQLVLYTAAVLAILALYVVWATGVQGYTLPLILISVVLLASLSKRIDVLLKPAANAAKETNRKRSRAASRR